MATNPYELTEIPSREEILAAYREQQPLVFKWFMPPAGEEVLESRVLMTRELPISDSATSVQILGKDLNVKEGSDVVILKIDFETNKGEIVYM